MIVVKNPPANAGDMRDMGSTPGSGRSSGWGHGNPLQYSYLENSMNRGAWRSMVHRIAEKDTTEATEHTYTHFCSNAWYCPKWDIVHCFQKLLFLDYASDLIISINLNIYFSKVQNLFRVCHTFRFFSILNILFLKVYALLSCLLNHTSYFKYILCVYHSS